MTISETVDALLRQAGYIRQHTRVSRCDTCAAILDGEYGVNKETGEAVCLGCFKKAQDVLTVIVKLIDEGKKPSDEAIAAIIANATVDGAGGLLETIRKRAFEFLSDDVDIATK